MDKSELCLLSDFQLAQHIEHCGVQMLAADKLGMKAERGRWLKAMEAALRERHSRPHLVAAMEQERDLA